MSSLETGLLIKVSQYESQLVSAVLIEYLIVVEHFRIVSNIVGVIFEVDTNTGKTICHPDTCPRMTAGR